MTNVRHGHTRFLGDLEVTTIVTGQRWRQNCYLLRHIPSGNAALIDPGDDVQEIWRHVQARSASLSYLLLTHGHYDHVGAAAAMSQQTRLPCYLHHDDARTLRHAPAYGLRFERRQIAPVTSFEHFQDGQVFHLGDARIVARHTPGHTPGSAAFVVGGVLFTGDTLFHRRIGRTDLPGGDAARLAASVDRLLAWTPDDTIMLAGHGHASTIGDARSWWVAEGRAALLQAEAATAPTAERAGSHSEEEVR